MIKQIIKIMQSDPSGLYIALTGCVLLGVAWSLLFIMQNWKGAGL